MTKEFIVDLIKKNKLVEKYLEGKEPLKIIYVKNKIINFIIK